MRSWVAWALVALLSVVAVLEGWLLARTVPAEATSTASTATSDPEIQVFEASEVEAVQRGEAAWLSDLLTPRDLEPPAADLVHHEVAAYMAAANAVFRFRRPARLSSLGQRELLQLHADRLEGRLVARLGTPLATDLLHAFQSTYGVDARITAALADGGATSP